LKITPDNQAIERQRVLSLAALEKEGKPHPSFTRMAIDETDSDEETEEEEEIVVNTKPAGRVLIEEIPEDTV